MARSFKELGKKTNELIEKGREIDQKVQGCQTQVIAQTSRVAMARRNLAIASETDSEGNPRGNIAVARAELAIAENILASHQRALTAAQNEAKVNQQEKKQQIQEIEKHNQTTRDNLDKLSGLDSLSHGRNSIELRKGMAERYNEAEEARIALLKSMGIDVSPELLFLSVEEKEKNAYIGLAIATPSHMEPIQSTGKNDDVEQSSLVAPVGGGLNAVPKSQNISSVSEGIISPKGHDDWGRMAYLIKEKQQAIPNEDPYVALVWELVDDYWKNVQNYLASNGLSNEKLKKELELLKKSLMITLTLSQNEDVEDHRREQVSVKRIPTDEVYRRGKEYINNMMVVYRENMINRGMISREALDKLTSDLRIQYETELQKEIDGLPNFLYEDPDYDKLAQLYKEYMRTFHEVINGENIFDSFRYNPELGINPGQQAASQQGFLGKPQSVSQNEFDDYVIQSGIVGYRTYSAGRDIVTDEDKNSRYFADQLRNGEDFRLNGSGRQVYGEGTYFAINHGYTQGVAPAKDDIEVALQDSRAYGRGKDVTTVVATIRSDAIIKDYDEVLSEFKKLNKSDQDRFGGRRNGVAAYAISQGIDGVVHRDWNLDYLILYNRTKLILLEEN